MTNNQEMFVRSFVAVSLPKQLKENLGDLIAQFKNRLKNGRTRVTWVKPESLHLTLKFLGSVDTKIIPSIIQKLKEAVTGIRPFAIVLGNLGVFPNLNQPKVIWVGVQRGEEEVCTLQKKTENNLAELGFSVEKRGFSPHLTLGRIKFLGGRGEVLRALKELDKPEIGEIDVARLYLMKSTLTPKGAIYEELGTVDFQNT